jgi:hypothetical protein
MHSLEFSDDLSRAIVARLAEVDANSNASHPGDASRHVLTRTFGPKQPLQRIGSKRWPFLDEITCSLPDHRCGAGLVHIAADGRVEGIDFCCQLIPEPPVLTAGSSAPLSHLLINFCPCQVVMNVVSST